MDGTFESVRLHPADSFLILLFTEDKKTSMARPAGRTNSDYSEKRSALLERMVPLVFSQMPTRPSLRELAKYAGVQPNTLRHYFGDRTGLILALLEHIAAKGERHFSRVETLAEAPPRVGIAQLIEWLLTGWDTVYGALLAGGMAEGMGDTQVGPAYLQRVLDPTLGSVERLLSRYVEQGDLPAMNTRAGALALIGPILFAAVHQGPLGGTHVSPLAMRTIAHEHVTAWIRGWGHPEVVPIH